MGLPIALFLPDWAVALRVQVMDERLAPIAGYLSERVTGDSVSHRIVWPQGRGLAELQGRAVRLKFLMKDTHLYSFAIT